MAGREEGVKDRWKVEGERERGVNECGGWGGGSMCVREWKEREKRKRAVHVKKNRNIETWPSKLERGGKSV